MTIETSESRPFEADVSRLLHMMVHSVYSDRDVFLRELISNAADACEKLRYEAIAAPELLGGDPRLTITISADPEAGTLTIADNGIGMSHDELIEALGTIARSGTRSFMDRIVGAEGKEGAQLIGQFGVGFYSAFMVASNVEVISRRVGSAEAWLWSSDGKGAFSVAPLSLDEAPARGTRVMLHLMDDAKSYAERWTLERIVKEQSGHVPVPITLVEKPGEEAKPLSDGAALWTKSKSDIAAQDYTDFYRSVAGQYDEPAATIHFRAEGRHEYTGLIFVPGARPFDVFDADRKGRIKLYVKRVFITDDAELLPRYLRFARGIVDSADLPLNVSREMIQDSPLLGAIRKGVTSRVISELVRLAEQDAEAFGKIWENFGAVIKEGLYEDFERREQLLGLARFKTTASGEGWRSLKDYVGALKENQTAIYYIAGDDAARIATSPHLEGFRARGIEVLLLADPVDSFWTSSGLDYEGKPFKSITQGAADLGLIPLLDAGAQPPAEASVEVQALVAAMKDVLGEEIADVRASDRLTDSAVCLVAAESGPDRQFARLLAASGRLGSAAKPILELNPKHAMIVGLAGNGDDAVRADVAHLLLDTARVLDGDRPSDAKAFSERLSRLIARSLG
ncbi:molecular chaperone HtpG [Ancylobacter dichloromethanicus]|uniref:Chaperone protein HtpG n=1 Tax=Ancylobacter dichloromethanicus TaxID=518825 RepID=A0A9W6N1R4_9HYPH|nr:molecular chaperone HtpG [Ancylobacter dichloromethanicus]MBS7552872.1 molecular chaperone HtpG [Ancylobacter dichloromethanicus]GLK74473.1 chaperone protein HtpG [Ancylobacter dichloromethanicus]